MQQKSNTLKKLSLNRSVSVMDESFVIKRGHYFKWFDSSGVDHIWFVLTNEHDGKFIIANVTSADTDTGKKVDESCVIKVDQYAFSKITKLSFVNYRGMKLEDVASLKAIIAEDKSFYGARAPAYMIDRMAGAMIMSMKAPPRCILHYKKVGH